MMRVYYRDSHGAVVLCDCTKKDSVAGAFRWKRDLDYKLRLDNGDPVPAVLLANKVGAEPPTEHPTPQADLKNEMSTGELHELAKQYGFSGAFKVSAKTGENVEEAMQFLIRQVIGAERAGLYVTPIFQRDHNVRRLASEESLQGRKSVKDALRSICC